VGPTKGGAVASDEALIRHVRDELYWDPKISDSGAIAVDATRGIVTLRGTVSSLRQRHEAKKAAERVSGVVDVHNELAVRPLVDEQRREDASIRGDVLQALMLNGLVPGALDAKVHDGVVTLTGEAEWQYQRDEAAFVASNVVGVVDVVNEIELIHSTPREGDVRGSIEKAFKRHAALEADDLHISVSHGTVTVDGTVRSWAEHDEAIAAAWAAPGVRAVVDNLKVVYF
jgi:osmotically-inducible protein OsmY